MLAVRRCLCSKHTHLDCSCRICGEGVLFCVKQPPAKQTAQNGHTSCCW